MGTLQPQTNRSDSNTVIGTLAVDGPAQFPPRYTKYFLYLFYYSPLHGSNNMRKIKKCIQTEM